MPISVLCDHCREVIRTFHLSEMKETEIDYTFCLATPLPDSARILDIPVKGKRLLCKKCQERLALALSEF